MLYFWFLMRLGGNCCNEGLPTHNVRDCGSFFLQQRKHDQLQHLVNNIIIKTIIILLYHDQERL